MKPKHSEPLYQLVYDTVLQRIADGTYAPSAMLPSEFDLGADLNVSQGTARNALNKLEARGIVTRRQGKGTFVTLRTPENSMFNFFRLRDSEGTLMAPELGAEDIKRRAATENEQNTLFGAPEEVFEIARIRNHKGQPLTIETSVVPVKMFPGLMDRGPLPNMLYILFQKAYSCLIIATEERLKAGLLGEEAGRRIGMDPLTPVLVVHRKSLDILDRVVELRRSVCITNEAHYSVRMD